MWKSKEMQKEKELSIHFSLMRRKLPKDTLFRDLAQLNKITQF